MGDYKTYKDKLELVDRYLYEVEDRLEEDKMERLNYYVNKNLKNKDEVDYLEDMIITIKLKFFKEIKIDIRMLMDIYDLKTKIDKE